MKCYWLTHSANNKAELRYCTIYDKVWSFVFYSLECKATLRKCSPIYTLIVEGIVLLAKVVFQNLKHSMWMFFYEAFLSSFFKHAECFCYSFWVNDFKCLFVLHCHYSKWCQKVLISPCISENLHLVSVSYIFHVLRPVPQEDWIKDTLSSYHEHNCQTFCCLLYFLFAFALFCRVGSLG